MREYGRDQVEIPCTVFLSTARGSRLWMARQDEEQLENMAGWVD